MLIEHFIVSNNSSIDVNTNSLSVFGILDDMQIQAPPGTPLNMPFHAVLIVKREKELETGALEASFRMSVFAPNGSRIGNEMVMPLQMQAAHRRSRLRVIAEIPLTMSGTYRIRMEHAGNSANVREVGVHVQIMPVAVPPPASSLPQ